MEEPPSWPWHSFECVENKGLHVAAVEAWLSRSGALPLSISLFFSHFYTPTGVDPLISSLLSFSYRWKNIALSMPPTYIPLITSLSKEAVPLLESFSYDPGAYSISRRRSKLAPCDILLAPHLRTLLSCHPAIIPPGINWAQLTTLSIGGQGQLDGGLSPKLGLEILSQCQNLIECRLDFALAWSQETPVAGYVTGTTTVPLLKTLAIKGENVIFGPFFEHLDLPALVNLEFSSYSSLQLLNDDFNNHPPLLVLLPRLGTLKCFTLLSHDLQRNDLLEYIRQTPSITQLSILSYSKFGPMIPRPEHLCYAFDDEALALMTPGIDSKITSMCPQLTILECNPCNVSDAALLGFIQARTIDATAHGVARLERVELNFHRKMEMDVMSLLPPNALAGTKVILTYHDPHARRRVLVPWAGLEEPERLEISTKFFGRRRF